MPTKTSAGLLLFRGGAEGLEVFLVHPGGPYWAKKDDGAWSIPKGEIGEGEDPLAAARREFEEETGLSVDGDVVALEPVRQPSGKVVHAWAMKGDVDASALTSNTFRMEWPPRSGRLQEFPEADRAAWFPMDVARKKVVKGQVGLLDQLEGRLTGSRAHRGAPPLDPPAGDESA